MLSYFHLKFLFIMLLGLTFVKCKSPKDLLSSGDYAKVINSLEGKAKKGKLSTSEKDIFVKACNGYLNNSKKDLELYLNSQNPEDWGKGVELLDELTAQQEQYLAYRQVLNKDVTAIDNDRWFVAFADKLYAHHWNNYQYINKEFDKTGNKLLMKDAYRELYSMSFYDNGTINIDSLINRSLELGHRKFNVEVVNRSFERFNFNYFENSIDLNSDEWNTYTFNATRADYNLFVTLEDVLTTEYLRSDRLRTYTDQVITGYNTVVDSTGTREEPIYQQVQAQVREVEYVYEANGSARIELFDIDNGKNEYSRPLNERLQDTNIRTFLISGDTRAIPPGVNPVSYTHLTLPTICSV